MFNLVNTINGRAEGQEIRPDRRQGDRRTRPTPLFSRYWLFGRRRGGRRTDEADNIYIDRYSAAEWFLVIGVLVLSVLDMVFTLVHLDDGGHRLTIRRNIRLLLPSMSIERGQGFNDHFTTGFPIP